MPAAVGYFFGHIRWIRSLCLLVCVFATFTAIVMSTGSGRAAVIRLESEGKPWSEAFRDGSLYTYESYISTAVPLFLAAISGLLVLAVAPRKSKAPEGGGGA